MSKKSSTFAAALRKSVRPESKIGAPDTNQQSVCGGESGGLEDFNESEAMKTQSVSESAERETR